jgi:two-component system LytT family response regulator/two-component system response regulator LytT
MNTDSPLPPTISYLIVDDELYARKQLSYLLQPYPDFKALGEAGNGLEAVDLIERLQPDVVFLDIQMPGFNGFDVLRQIRSDRLPLLVFITAHNTFAIRAFEVEALDYLLKPVSEQRFDLVIQRLRKRRADHQHQKTIDLDRFTGTLNDPLTRLPVRNGQRIVLIPFTEVFWLELENRIVFAITDQGRLPTHFETLKELEGRLREQEFFRINRNQLVNLSQIAELIPFGNHQLQLKTKQLPANPLVVSREQSKSLKLRLGL